MTIRIDFLGNTPEIGNIIVFNPPRYKGLVKGFLYWISGIGITPSFRNRRRGLLAKITNKNLWVLCT